MLDKVGTARGTTLLGGDFNIRGGNPIHQWILDRGYRDSWQELHGVHRCKESNGCTVPADHPDRRIDCIFTAPAVNALGSGVRASTALAPGEGCGRQATCASPVALAGGG
ncbi:MAG: hypothetical protein ACRDT0_12615 [Pseudonocardiaceae bacterium]